jgi:hypothetical protein
MGCFCDDGYFSPRTTGNVFSSRINMELAARICMLVTHALHVLLAMVLHRLQIVSNVDRYVIIGKLLEFIFNIFSVILRRWEI